MKKIILKFTVALLITVGFCMIGTNKSKAAGTYLIKINKQQCVVTVYKQDKKGKYTVPVRAMLCSPGTATPLGTFSLKEKIRWHTLDGPVYGQYCSRIVNGVLFHSVWYYNNGDPSTLSSAQYNNLGYQVSHGCVRLAVRDSKWIYDNCSSGTTVVIYNAKNPGPLGKPVSIKLPGYTNWDPTDIWYSNNPWNKKKPKITGAENKSIVYASKYNITKGLKVTNTTGYNAKKLLETDIRFNDGSSPRFKKVKKVNTRKPGIYRITYKIKDEIGRKAKVTVRHKVLTKVSVSKITLNKSKATLYLGGKANKKKADLSVKKVLPKKASITDLSIKSSNPKIAGIKVKGKKVKVTAKKAGQCEIIFTAKDGSGTKASCKITVKQLAAKLTLTAGSGKMYVGSTLKLNAKFTPSNTSDKRIAYTSSNPEVAAVSSGGTVRALKAGTVRITAKAKDGSGRTASVTLTILHKYGGVVSGPAVDMTLSSEDDFIKEMEKLPKTLIIKDVNGYTTEAGVTWDTSEYHSETEQCNVYGVITLPPGWEGTPDKYKITVQIQRENE